MIRCLTHIGLLCAVKLIGIGTKSRTIWQLLTGRAFTWKKNGESDMEVSVLQTGITDEKRREFLEDKP